MLKKSICWLARRVPLQIFEKSEHFLNRLGIDYFEIERQRAWMFAERLKTEFDTVISQISKNRKVMVISEGEYSYHCFNAAYLNNMIGLIFYALYKGCIPRIEINKDKVDCNQWDWYFEQPEQTVWADVNTADFDVVPCDKKKWVCPTLSDAFELSGNCFCFWNYFYQKLLKLNEKTLNYFCEELNMLPVGEKLAVLIRGTDYVALKPKGHTVQPTIDELMEEVDILLSKKSYQYIYVATEEKQLFDQFVRKYGDKRVLSNKRSYYDIYWHDGHHLIGEISFERENDVYLRGIEYLSSMIIVSRCDGFVGGNCGGTLMAALMASEHGNMIVMNKGYY